MGEDAKSCQDKCTAMCEGGGRDERTRAPPQQARCDWRTIVLATLLLCIGVAAAGLGIVKGVAWVAFGGIVLTAVGAGLLVPFLV
jgi:hypothetical protein